MSIHHAHPPSRRRSMKPRTLIIGVAIVLLAAVAVALAFVPKASTDLPASGDVTNKGAKDLITRGARVIDVRTAAEFAAGHIAGAENVPVDDVPTAAAGWAKTAPLVVYCATGARSLNAAEYLKAQGFTRVYNLAAGVAAWDGELVKGTTAGSGGSTSVPATGRPTMYDFYGDT
jgi:rhodanese-related sulfurtransferase